MFTRQTLALMGATLTAALLAAPAGAAAPGYSGGYNPGYFSGQHGGYYPGAYSGRAGFGGYNPGYFSGYPAGYGGYSGGYYPGYYSDLHAESTYPSPYTPTTTTPYVPPSVISSGFRSMLPEMRTLEAVDPSRTDGGALIDVRVPSEAQVWFDGDKTAQTGDERQFKSAPLPVGRLYHYEVRARWTEGGQVKDETRKVPVSANRVTDVDFTRPEAGAGPSR